MTQTGSKPKSEIKSAAIYRCTAKHDMVIKDIRFRQGDVFYLVNSDSEDTTYVVYYDGFLRRHLCTCPAHTTDCKHIRAAVEVARARQEIRKQQAAISATYDVVGAALAVVNQARADVQVADFYEQRAKDIERTRLLNYELGIGA